MSLSLSHTHTHTHIHTHTYTSLSFGLGVASWSIWFPNLGKNRMDNPSGSKENGKQINTYSTVNQRVHTPVHARTQAHTRTRTHAHTQRIRKIVFINGIVAPPEQTRYWWPHLQVMFWCQQSAFVSLPTNHSPCHVTQHTATNGLRGTNTNITR